MNLLKKMGVKISTKKNSITVIKNKNLKKANISTKPYPGFPTDLQAQFMVLMTQAKGLSKIKENILKIDLCMFQSLKEWALKLKLKIR